MKNYRKIWESHFGSIPKDENGVSYHIHHIDGNRNNNHISNLQCVSIYEHFSIHLRQGDIQACARLLGLMSIQEELKSELISSIQKGRKHSKETKRKMSKAAKGRSAWNKGKINLIAKERMIMNNPMKDPKIAKKVSIKLRGKSPGNKGVKMKNINPNYINPMKGRTHSKESRRKMSERISKKSYWYFPDGTIEISHNMKETCKKYNISYSAVRHKIDSGPYLRGKYKGLEITRDRKSLPYKQAPGHLQ